MTRTNDTHRRGGFTLMELLMALAIGVIITGITVTVFRQAAGVYSLANAKLDATMGARAALSIIEKDLQGAFLNPQGDLFRGPSFSPVQTNTLSVYTTPVAAYGAAGSPAPGSRVQYFLVPDRAFSIPGQGPVPTFSLVRYDFPGNTPASGDTLDPASFDARTLVYGLRMFYVQYYDALADATGDSDGDGNVDEDPTDNTDNDGDGLFDEDDPGAWVGRWDSTQPANPHQYRRLPAAVRVVIETVDRQGYLLRPDQTPFRVRRIVEVGTQASGQ